MNEEVARRAKELIELLDRVKLMQSRLEKGIVISMDYIDNDSGEIMTAMVDENVRSYVAAGILNVVASLVADLTRQLETL